MSMNDDDTPSIEVEKRNVDDRHSLEKTSSYGDAEKGNIPELLNSNKLPSFVTAGINNPHFIHDLEWTKEEEDAVKKIIDTRIFPWVLLTTFVLNMDRTNNSNAVSDKLPADLGVTIDTVNTATMLYSIIFSIFTLTGAIIAKRVGPAFCKSKYTFTGKETGIPF